MSKQVSKSYQKAVDSSKVEEIAYHFQSEIDRLDEPRKSLLTNLMNTDFGTSFLIAPSSARKDYHFCYPGGLAAHSIDVANNVVKLANVLCLDKYTESQLKFLGLVHDLGKAGDGKDEYYRWNDSDWHQTRGILYEINEECMPMTISDRTIFLLQQAGITLNSDELLALRLVETEPNEVPMMYRYREPDLALLLSWGNRWSIQTAKDEK